jgi:intracellular sulfur oxidation DsrE/DsrF family protein
MPRSLFCLLLLAFALGGVAPNAFAQAPKSHRLAVQIDSDDPALMNMALNNIGNAAALYAGRGEAVEIELVADGPGLVMLRDDLSPVKARLAELHKNLPFLVLSACGVTMKAVTEREGKVLPLVPGAAVVPSGVVRLVELQEQGWSYIRP